jgi:hypothetical protein
VVSGPDGFIRASTTRSRSGSAPITVISRRYGFNGYRDQCLRFGPARRNIGLHRRHLNGGTYNYVFVPVVLQWNFGSPSGSGVRRAAPERLLPGNYGSGPAPRFPSAAASGSRTASP